MAATSAIRGFGAQNGTLMGKEITSDSLVAILASCSNMGLQVGGLGDVMVGCGDKRPFYPGASFAGSPGEEAGDEDGGGDCSHNVEKKRRLTFDQVRSLERNFELENKLEPERKMQLSKELGLQPRQVAVWFQNRRARWKTKQLERDYEVLSVAYNRLKAEFEAIVQEKDRLKSEVHRLSVKTELPACDGVEPSSLSESETTTHTSENAAQVNSVTIKTETVIKKSDQEQDDQLVETRDSRTQSTRLESPTVDQLAAAGGGSTQSIKVDQEEQSTSADSNSSDILNTDSPRTIDNCTTQLPSSTTLVQQMATTTTEDQQAVATTNSLCCPAHDDDAHQLAGAPADHQSTSSFVVDSSCLLQVDDDDDLCAAERVILSPQTVYQRPTVNIKLEDGSNYQDDHSCIYFLSQLDDKTGATPWWDWS